jgi:uncharacterized protein
MSPECLFLDTAYVLALVDRRDQYHVSALALQHRLRDAAEVWTTEAVLLEIGNSLSASNRGQAVRLNRRAYETRNLRVAPLTTKPLLEALVLYESRSDKQWGLTDCISFVVMRTQDLTDALTSDHHFLQAGYRALLLEGS